MILEISILIFWCNFSSFALKWKKNIVLIIFSRQFMWGHCGFYILTLNSQYFFINNIVITPHKQKSVLAFVV